ncbi:MAG TPA: LuxR C-terminal-related transcriptional regulator, partial [Candidatus Dormibacteraeota bacterium]|nr:LuxR C-terminal-related transcriptional regulator [Candidatus Dormibacteraeota bacterium]
ARGAADAFLLSGDPAGAAAAWRLVGAVRWREEAISEALAAFDRALELLPRPDGAPAAEILLQLADLHASSLSRPAAGLARAERALAIVRPLGDRRLEAAACCTAGNVRARASDLDGGRALLERGLLLARERGDPAQAAEACASLANVAYWSGDIAAAWRFQSEREELARRTQDPYELRHVYAWLGTLRACRGEWDAADRLFEREEAIVGQLESPEPLAFLRAMRAGQQHRRGRFAEAEASYRQAIDVLRRAGSGTLVWYLAGHGQALADLGRPGEAWARAEETERVVSTLDEGSLVRGFALAGLALLYIRLDAAAAAAACYPRMRAHPGRFHGVLFDRALGVAAAAAGDVEAGREALARAEALARREGLRPELAVTLLQRGVIQRATEPAAARTAIDEGRRLAANLGMGELARRLLDVPARGGRASDELTPRERELLRELASGRTNRQIAAALSVSEKTVANSLTTVFAKLGVENRAAAVAHALRHDMD